ncbi:hypothetical protein RDI58_026847 [Solanum bulbocastanum]|uniref:Leucine-rich repeat-containing N-terminal plant-type domain-containing protein n=1 Tax=Solanum bulbocastanum TaxID=147425 RepID=A0AAN8SZR8_SOLBU
MSLQFCTLEGPFHQKIVTYLRSYCINLKDIHPQIDCNACLPADQEALMDIKATLKEPYLGIFNTWTGSNCCQGWYGVSCDPTTQRVADIVLLGESEDPIYKKAGRFGYMTNSLSPSLCKLDNLTTLIVADWKDISGEIPACVTSLPDLRILELIGNKITGTIPKNIGQLSKLTVLNLADNKICGSIPASIVNLEKLKHLELSNNQLSGEIPSDIGKLGMEEEFFVKINLLTG